MLSPSIRAELMPLSEIAGRLQRLMKRNASDADYVPIVAISRYLEIHRDTVYQALNDEPVNRYIQILLSRFLIRLEAGELEPRQIPGTKGRYELVVVENPKPRLRLRIELNLGGTGPRLTGSPYQVPPKLPSFDHVFGRR